MQELKFEQVNVVSGGVTWGEFSDILSGLYSGVFEQTIGDSGGSEELWLGGAMPPPSQALGWFIGIATTLIYDVLGGTSTVENGLNRAIEIKMEALLRDIENGTAYD